MLHPLPNLSVFTSQVASEFGSALKSEAVVRVQVRTVCPTTGCSPARGPHLDLWAEGLLAWINCAGIYPCPCRRATCLRWVAAMC